LTTCPAVLSRPRMITEASTTYMNLSILVVTLKTGPTVRRR
jgi:hypothetical protein